MRRFVPFVLSLAVCAAVVALPAAPATAIEPPRVRITPATSSVVLGATRQLTATVKNLTDESVTWSVRSGPATGTVSATGLFTPPAQLPPLQAPAAVVRATSVEDPSVYGEATVTIASGLSGTGFGAGRDVSGGSYDLETGDVTGDGLADVVQLQIGANSLQLFRLVTQVSDGAGGFTSSASAYTYLGSGINDFAGDLGLGDLDADGDVDAFVAIEAMNSSPMNRFVVYRNNGIGGWTADPVSTATTNEGRSGARLELTDFDGDGDLDAVRLDRFGTVVLQRNTGTGTFLQGVPLYSVFSGRTLAVGDLTGDGRPEIAVGTLTTSTIETTFDVAVNDGFGAIAGRTTYTAGLNPEPAIADVDGDGWNDLLAGIGGEGATHHPPKLLAFRNLGTGSGGLATTGTQLMAFRPQDLHPVHLDGDGLIDLAGLTARGPMLARRTATGYDTRHAAAEFPHHAGVADVTGDGRTDVFVSSDGASRFWPGSADATFAFSVNPGTTRVNATLTAAFTASAVNAPAPVNVTWSATRGTFSAATYTAPASAAPAGTPVTVTALLNGTTSTATREITVVNEKFQFTSLGGRIVRHVVADPGAPNTLYAATDLGVHRSLNGGATFAPLGSTANTGTDARRVAVVRDPGSGTARLLAVFGTSMFGFDLAAPGDWAATAGIGSVTGLSTVPGSLVGWAAAGGQLHRTTNGGTTWAPAGGTSVTDVAATGPETLWAVRSADPRIVRGTFGETLTLTPRATPYPAAAVTSIAPDPANGDLLYATVTDSGGRLLRGDGATGTWAVLPVPDTVDRVAVSPTGAVLAGRSASAQVFKSVDAGGSWYSLNRGFPSGFGLQTIAHRVDGLDLLGSSGGLYTPFETVPPEVPVVTGGPSGTTGPGGAGAFSFAFTATGTSHLCALDGTGWTTCTSPKAYNGPLASGTHTFSVVAVDENGNESAAATRAWEVDATPPALPELLTGPSGAVASTGATFTFSLPADAAGARCSLDGAAATDCASGVAYSALAQGPHTFAVQAVDAFGNVSGAVTRGWTVDTVGPAHPWFQRTARSVDPSSTAYFSWYVDPSATYACTLDGEPVACTNGYAASGLTHGEHVFRVTASDPAGNTSSNSFSWSVDLAPPDAPVISVSPQAVTNLTTARFEYASPSTDAYLYVCTLDGSTAYCEGSADYASLAPGGHTFTVAAIDYAGNTSAPTTFEWTVTNQPPPATPAILTGPSGLVNSRTATFTFTVGEGLAPKCSLDGAAPAACASGVSYTGLADGPHTFALYAASGELLSEPATRSWNVDATAPDAPALTGSPASRTSSGVAMFGWTPDPALDYTCALDGQPVACGDGTYAARGLAEGAHQFVLTATDEAGNTAATAYGWTVDLTGPVTSLATAPPAATNLATATFEFSSAAADLDRFDCTVDGVLDDDCASPLSLAGLAPGAHTFQVVAYDDLGNPGTPVTRTWTVDQTAPVVTMAAPPAVLNPGLVASFGEPVTGVTGSTVRLLLTGTATAVPATLACRTATNGAVACTAPTVRSVVLTPAQPLTPGQLYTYQVVGGPAAVRDLAGNAAATKAYAFRASTSEQETSLIARQGWRRAAWAGAQGGAYEVSDVRGATATYTFTGTGVTWYGVRGPTYGTADVYVDNVLKASRVNFYSPSTGALTRTITGLTNARHTLKIVVRGEKGSTAGKGTDVAVDAFKVGTALAANPPVAYAWARVGAAPASGAAYALEDARGATYTFTFRGRGVDWITVLGPNMGRATVHIDGVHKGTFDNWASAPRYGGGRSFTGLADKVHTITITVLGERRAGATGSYVAVDRLGVRP